MITSEKTQDYSMLFDKASRKIGLIPIVRRELRNGEIVDVYYRSILDPVTNTWKERECVPEEMDDNYHFYKYAEGSDESNPVYTTEVLQGISSLNEYFHYIPDLAKAAVTFGGRTGTDPYFLRLPLDEPFLEIDANTRTITVPAALRQIGVMGDKYAEILFFKIDRYFEAVDLATRDIYIEWEINNEIKGFSRDFLKDTQSEKDKIIFGWLIDDTLTKTPGTIRFSVRFVEWEQKDENIDGAYEGGTILYSFSTLTNTINVIDSLNYTLFENDSDYNNYNTAKTTDDIGKLIWHLDPSDLDGEDSSTPDYAPKPKFIRDFDESGIINLEGANPELKHQSFTLEVEAIPESGSGVISYSFGRKKPTEQTFGGNLPVEIKFKTITINDLPTSDDGRNYYYFKENSVLTMVKYDEAKTRLLAGDEVREKVAQYVVTEPDDYIARAYNQVTGKRISTAYSHQINVPAAQPAEVDSVVTDETLGYKPFVINKKVYIEAVDLNGEISDVIFREDESQRGPETTTLELKHLVGNAMQYQWFKGDDLSMSNAVALEGETGTALIVGGGEGHYGPGFYSAKIMNFLNNSDAETGFDKVGVCRVTDMPTSTVVTNWDDFTGKLRSKTVTPLKVQKPLLSDEVTFEWRRVTSEGEDQDILNPSDFGASVSGTVVFDEADNTIGSIDFAPIWGGTYFIIFYNHYNGATTVTNGATELGAIEVEQIIPIDPEA